MRAAIFAIGHRVAKTTAETGADTLVARIGASGTLRPDELASAVAVLMFGAIETAEGMTANALWHVLSHPEVPKTGTGHLSLLAANRDPETFDHPDRLDLRRPNAGRHVTFAQGPHGCLGVHMARLETTAAINGLLRATAGRGLTLDADASDQPTGLIFRRPNAVVAHWR